MTVKELQEAIRNKRSVLAWHESSGRWAEYECVLSITYSEFDGKPQISATLKDYCGHSVITVRARDVKYKE